MAADFNINLEEAYQGAFGVRRPIFVSKSVDEEQPDYGFTKGEAPESKSIKFEALSPLKFDTSSVKSPLGTLVLSPITFKGGSYKEHQADGRIINSTYREVQLTPTATLEVNIRKRIIETPRYGGYGSFDELSGTEDPQVLIRGLLLGEDLKRPEEQIRELVNLERVPHAIKVVCDYLSWLNINYLIIKEVKFPMLQGQPSTQPFEMLCKASIPDY